MKEKEDLLEKEISQIEELLILVKRQEKVVLEGGELDRLSLLLKEGQEKAKKLKKIHKKVEFSRTNSINQEKIEKRDYLLKELSDSVKKIEDLIKKEMDKVGEELILLSKIGIFKKQSKRGSSYFIDKRW